jgi:hypothetical protein
LNHLAALTSVSKVARHVLFLQQQVISCLDPLAAFAGISVVRPSPWSPRLRCPPAVARNYLRGRQVTLRRCRISFEGSGDQERLAFALNEFFGRWLPGSCKASVAMQEKALSGYQVYVAEHYASKDFLSDLKREITESIRDSGRHIDHVFHPDQD